MYHCLFKPSQTDLKNCFLNIALEYAHLSNMDLLNNLIVKLVYANIKNQFRDIYTFLLH